MSILNSNKPWYLDWLFSRYRWYRRWCGGHWELWWNDVCHADMWERLTICTQTGISKEESIRPPCCMGTPTCEHYSGSEANARLLANAKQLYEALELALTRMAHKQGCMVCLPSDQWAERGSWAADNCQCEIAIVKAALAVARGEKQK